MARRATALRRLREAEPDLLLLSAGDFYGKPGIIEMYRSRFLAARMVEMGYDAVALGERELAYGLRAIRADAEAGLPVICANLYESGERVFPPYVLRTAGGCRIGVFALLGENPRDAQGVELRDAAEEGRSVLAELEGKSCDCIICLAHMSAERLAAMLPRLGGVDIVIRGHAGDGAPVAEDCADTLGGTFEELGVPVLFAGDRGRALGRFTVMPDRDGRASILERSIIHLDRSFPEDQAVAARLGAFAEEEGLRAREMRVSELVARDEVTGKVRERYLGFDICARCHGELAGRFLESRHFRAFGTLELRGEAGSRECLPCHTTGFARFSGYNPDQSRAGGVDLRGVQCEACHGPGTLHARDGSYVGRAWKSCRECHTSAWSPDFEERSYWERAAHCGAASRPADRGDHQ